MFCFRFFGFRAFFWGVLRLFVCALSVCCVFCTCLIFVFYLFYVLSGGVCFLYACCVCFDVFVHFMGGVLCVRGCFVCVFMCFLCVLRDCVRGFL